ncbi:uncharacterized protein NEMAJ01_2030 [Nematocida major]|uniref:uncharacterized protein n=1 Tax=Nematocida major TaxID=1912982 RepID=UPI0020082974|nr:uncharacterized protein NEMAJ01_2030 [Nematocida major]KAH9387134.1 hypothetical protein NEMAJ01_2030 [Nematocida major]
MFDMANSCITTSEERRVKNANLPKIYYAGERKASAKYTQQDRDTEDSDWETPRESKPKEARFPSGNPEELRHIGEILDALRASCNYGGKVERILEELELRLHLQAWGHDMAPSIRVYCLAIGISDIKFPNLAEARRALVELSRRLFAEESRNQGRGWTEVKPDVIERFESTRNYKPYQFPRRPERVSEWEVWLSRVATAIMMELTTFPELKAEIMEAPEKYPWGWDEVKFNQHSKEVLKQLWKTMQEYIRIMAPRERNPETKSSPKNKSKSSRSTVVCTKCKRKGHSQETCYAKTRDAQDRQKESSAGRATGKEAAWKTLARMGTADSMALVDTGACATILRKEVYTELKQEVGVMGEGSAGKACGRGREVACGPAEGRLSRWRALEGVCPEDLAGRGRQACRPGEDAK